MPDITEASSSLVDQLRRLADEYGAAGVADIARQLCVDEGPAARNPERTAGTGMAEALANVHVAGRAIRLSVDRGSELADSLLPPFQAASVLADEITALDEWVETFIGRLQPYCVNRGVPACELHAKDEPPIRSPLEQRIYEQASRVRQIRSALDEMNQNLAL